ncbi:Uncharacterised protein [Bacteroides uniformis]|uniref:Uncharacterized protein n=1 Tax=Bacteroides uniformis TaxID=820 RepID=A0A174RYB4_BACUN|nr:Uncharacterised protein [Bacteroides uniformis]
MWLLIIIHKSQDVSNGNLVNFNDRGYCVRLMLYLIA